WLTARFRISTIPKALPASRSARASSNASAPDRPSTTRMSISTWATTQKWSVPIARHITCSTPRCPPEPQFRKPRCSISITPDPRAQMAPIRLVYIAGAGISGLTLALALARFGLRVVVLERHGTVGDEGAGIQISPNARKILDRLGLEDALCRDGFEPAGIDVIPSGRVQPIQTLALGKAVAERFGAPYAVIHRGDLAHALYEATKRFANIEVLFGIEAFSVRPNETGVAVTYTQSGREPV